MKKIFTFLLFISIASTSMMAQRYIDEVFTDVTVTSDVTYGVNATVLYLGIVGEAVPEELKMDVYEPTGDTETERPLVLVFHTGNFLPNVTNGQISGTRQDNGTVEICKQLARKGYVAASVSYRLGWNPLADTQPIRALGLIQAAYRGLQDGRTAARYFRKDVAENGNQFGVDPTKIVAWGNGTGGYLTLAMATLDDYVEIPSTTNGPAKFVLDLNGDGQPETPMVIPQYHGDIEGKVLTIAPDGNFGVPAGDTTNYPNHVDYSSDINLVVNVGGSLGDVGWVDENTVPILTVQNPFDIFAPYDDKVLIVPTTGDGVVRVQGGSIVHPRLDELGVNSILDDKNLDSDITDVAIANSALANPPHDYYPGLFPFIRPVNSSGISEGVVIEWWDPNALSPPILPDFPNGVPWNMLPHPAGGTFHDQGLILNEGMSEEKAKANIADVMSFLAPRMCYVLELGNCEPLSSKDPILDASVLTLSPNPASASVKVSAEGRIINSIAIFGMDGRLYGQTTNVNSESATIYRNNLPTGIYFVKAYFDEGVATQKVTFE